MICIALNVTSHAEDPFWSEVTADQLFPDDTGPLVRGQTPQASESTAAGARTCVQNGTLFYVKPGVGIEPDKFNREWGLECGLRFVF